GGDRMLSAYLSMLSTAADKSFVESLYNDYEREMYAAAYSVFKNKADAEDAVHDAFLRVIKNIDRLRTFSCHELKLYLIVTSRNSAFALYNKRTKRAECDIDEFYDLDSGVDIERQAQISAGVAEIAAAMRQLSDHDYELLYLHIVKGYKPREVAELLGLSPENARQQIHRARMKLIKRLRERGVGNG
ncbi:MAG: sigma-70 family RNA polymerase sigma factor, partial [Oscillospiraceae bacterium]|nr:sigma-70 family RNA polymerase sigma factor [Oscillospiraceae bacterium]